MSQEGRDKNGKFSKGNLFALGLTNSGRPPKYSDPQVMAEKIAEYLEYEDSKKRPDSYSGQGKGIYTIAGCALYLGFASRQQLWEYQSKSAEFNYVILRFKEFLTYWNEQKLYWGGTFPAANFWLKNWGGYKDEQTVNQNNTIVANYGGSKDVRTSRESGDDS